MLPKKSRQSTHARLANKNPLQYERVRICHPDSQALKSRENCSEFTCTSTANQFVSIKALLQEKETFAWQTRQKESCHYWICLSIYNEHWINTPTEKISLQGITPMHAIRHNGNERPFYESKKFGTVGLSLGRYTVVRLDVFLKSRSILDTLLMHWP